MKNVSFSLLIATGCFVAILNNTAYAKPDPPITPEVIVLTGYQTNEPLLGGKVADMLRRVPGLFYHVATLDYRSDVTTAFPNAKIVVAQLRGMEWRGNDNGDTLKQTLTKAFVYGMNILLYGDTYLQSANAVGDSYFDDTFGVSCSFSDIQEKIMFQNPGYAISPFDITGVENDILLGSGKSIYKRKANVSWKIYDDTRGTLYTSALGSIRSSKSSVIPFLYYDDNKENIAGVRMISQYDSRAVVLSFRIESIADSTQRTDFLSRVITWLGGMPTSVEEETDQRMSIAPLPANDVISIRVPLTAQLTSLTVVNMLGETVLDADCSSPQQEIVLSTSGIASGYYRVVGAFGSKRFSSPLLIQR
ncbi:MAG: hypothetical protein JNL32_06645 [Candidatus Kapabacteria bacterium]|nr:hypothetical protein [Candidatus Kapabacteria bacterium]